MIIKKQQDAAKFLGISQPRFNKLLHQGKFDAALISSQGKHKEWDADALKEAFHGSRDPMQDHRTGNKKTSTDEKVKTIKSAGVKTGMDYHTARTLNEQYKAAKAKIEYEKEIKSLINAEKFVKLSFDIARQVRDSALAIGDRCSPLVAVEQDQFKCKKILDQEVKHILENLANAIKNITSLE